MTRSFPHKQFGFRVTKEDEIKNLGRGRDRSHERPPRRSVGTELLHAALALNESGQSLFGPGMKDAGWGQPGIGDFRHAVPSEPGFLTTTAQGSVPYPL